jgi:alpha-methylacyl-CoA racemase
LSGLDLPSHDDQYDPATWPKRTTTFAARFATRTRDAWGEVFADLDACVAPVLAFDEAPLHPANAERGVFFNAQGTWQARPAPRFSRSQPGQPAPPTAPGADTRDILRSLGYSRDDIEVFEQRGALPEIETG